MQRYKFFCYFHKKMFIFYFYSFSVMFMLKCALNE